MSVTDRLEKRDPILGGACFCSQVHCEQLGFHLGRGMLHHKVVDLLGIFVSPFLLVVGMVVLPLPFCCLNKVGQILWVIWESNTWLLELTNCQCSKQAIVLQTVHNVLRDGFDIEIEGGHFSQVRAFGISPATGDWTLLLTKTIKFYTSYMGISMLTSKYPLS
jgi:hypothetical protein